MLIKQQNISQAFAAGEMIIVDFYSECDASIHRSRKEKSLSLTIRADRRQFSELKVKVKYCSNAKKAQDAFLFLTIKMYAN